MRGSENTAENWTSGGRTKDKNVLFVIKNPKVKRSKAQVKKQDEKASEEFEKMKEEFEQLERMGRPLPKDEQEEAMRWFVGKSASSSER